MSSHTCWAEGDHGRIKADSHNGRVFSIVDRRGDKVDFYDGYRIKFLDVGERSLYYGHHASEFDIITVGYWYEVDGELLYEPPVSETRREAYRAPSVAYCVYDKHDRRLVRPDTTVLAGPELSVRGGDFIQAVDVRPALGYSDIGHDRLIPLTRCAYLKYEKAVGGFVTVPPVGNVDVDNRWVSAQELSPSHPDYVEVED